MKRPTCIVCALLFVGAGTARAQTRAAIGGEVGAGSGAALEVGGDTPGSGERVAGTLDHRLPPVADTNLQWSDHLRRFHLAEGIFSGLLGAVGIAAYIGPSVDGHETARWQNGNPFDDGLRDAFALSHYADRRVAATASDAVVAGLTLAPVAIDAILTAWVARGSSDVALQMLLIDFQAHALAQALTGVVKWGVARERPVGRSCRTDDPRSQGDPTCDGEVAPHSFFSGHTSLAFTSAALVCLHHTELGLLGEAGDAAVCATGLTLATGVGALRMMADKHYASDVLIGAGVGLVSGWLLPYLLHYAQFDGGPRSDFRAAIAPSFDQTQATLQVMGQF